MTESLGGVRVITLGCRLNAWEAEVIRGEAAAAGLDDAVIVNTCAVTAEAVRQARQTIRRARRDRPQSRIIVTGCAAQLSPDTFAAMPEVDRVLGNAEKLERKHLAGGGDRIVVSDIQTVRETAGHLIDGFEGRARAFVLVQQGCDHRCTFCVIPFARGRNRSVAAPRVVEQVRSLVAGGFAEVVMTGVDICSWGLDLGDGRRLGDLVAEVLAAVPELKRLRLSTLDPAAIDARLYRVLALEPRLMPHWHLSLQAGSDMVLKRMRRRHTVAAATAVVAAARRARPDIVFGADLIAGFPTESEEMFAETLTAVDRLGLSYLHVFPYSPRAGTPAARMPQVPKAVRLDRAARLRAAGEAVRRTYFASRVGGDDEALVEAPGRGRLPDYAPVRFDAAAASGPLVRLRITGAEGESLIGELAA